MSKSFPRCSVSKGSLKGRNRRVHLHRYKLAKKREHLLYRRRATGSRRGGPR